MPFNPYLFNVKVADFESPVINRLSSPTIIDNAKTVHLLVSFKARSYDVLKQAGLLLPETVAQIKDKICRYIFHEWYTYEYNDYLHPDEIQKDLIQELKSIVSLEADSPDLPEYKLAIHIKIDRLLEEYDDAEIEDILVRLKYFILGELSTTRVLCRVTK